MSHCLFDTCPSENELVAMIQGGLASAEIQQIEEGIDRCPACHELWVALAQIFSPEDDATKPLPSDGIALSQIHQYHIYKELGVGGMGVVYEAFDSHLQRRVALKLLRPDVFHPEVREHHASRLLQEARLLANLTHPHIPVVYEVGTWEGQMFMAVQLIRGRNVRQWIRETSPDWQAIVDVYIQVAKALSAAHDAGIVHRDVKPDNILVDRDGRALLTDFGLALSSSEQSILLSGQSPWSSTLPPPHDDALPEVPRTEAGMVVGTPAYMAPEQRQGQVALAQTDQYAWCVSLYESLCGIAPFPANPPTSSMEQPALYIPEGTSIPKQLFGVIAQGLRRVPVERHPSMAALVESLGAALVAPVRSRAKVWSFAAMVFVVSCLILAILWGRWGLREPLERAGQNAVQQRVPKRQRRLEPVPRRRVAARVAMARPEVRRTVIRRVVSARRVVREKRASRRRRFRRARRRSSRKRRRIVLRRRKRRVAMARRVAVRKMTYSPPVMVSVRLHRELTNALQRFDGKRCLAIVEKMKKLAKSLPSLAFSTPWHEGRCSMIAGKCQRGARLVRGYYRRIGTPVGSLNYRVKDDILRLCPATSGHWRTRLKRMYYQTLQIQTQRLSVCRRFARTFEWLWRRHRSAVMAGEKLRDWLGASAVKIAMCYGHARRCKQARGMWWHGKEILNDGRPMKGVSLSLARALFRREVPRCRP